jgi:membrane protein
MSLERSFATLLFVVTNTKSLATETPATLDEGASLWRLRRITWRQLIKHIIEDVQENDLLDAAAGLAFSFLLGLFPLMIFLFSLFGLVASHSSQLENHLFEALADFVPPQAFLLITQVTAELAKNATSGKLTFGIILALWFASSGMTSMMSSLNYAYHTHEQRPWYVVRAIGLGLTFGISVLLFSALFLVSIGERLVEWTSGQFGLDSVLTAIGKGLQWPAALLFVMVSFSLAYYFGPNVARRRWRWATPGSIFGAILWLAASLGFRVYLHFFDTYSATYGSLAALVILLVWLYVTGLAFLIGAEIDAEIERAVTNEPRQAT